MTTTALADAAQHADRVEEFKAALRTLPTRKVIQKHITTGSPAAFDNSAYFEIRERIAREYEIHPAAVVVVGSCRTGFSLKQKGPSGARVRYAPVNSASDVDVAVVSADLFDQLWDRVFTQTSRQRGWAMNGGKLFTRDLYSGWISPNKLPPLPSFEFAKRWAEFFARLSNDRICGIRQISARLYRTWHRLEMYQDLMVTECKGELDAEESK